jgi:hypothetical protein
VKTTIHAFKVEAVGPSSLHVPPCAAAIAVKLNHNQALELIGALARYVRANVPADFVLHGELEKVA